MDTTTPARRNIVQRLGDWLNAPRVIAALEFVFVGFTLGNVSDAVREGRPYTAAMLTGVTAYLIVIATISIRKLEPARRTTPGR